MPYLSLAQSCPHLATPQEQARDPGYLACDARPGEACRWAHRYDGVAVPEFHAERLEFAVLQPVPGSDAEPAQFREWVLESGLV